MGGIAENAEGSARRSERCGEGFEGIGDDGGAEEGAEFFGIGDGFEGVAEAVGDGAEAEIEGFEDGLAALFYAAIRSAFEFAGGEAFLAEMLGESHGAGAVGLVADTVNSAEDAGPVNWVGAIEDVGDEAVEEAAGDMGEEVVVPDGVAEETADGFGFERAEDEDAVGRAADGVEGDGGELDESEGEVGQEGAEDVEGGGVAEEGGELGAEFPDSAVLGEDDGEDDREGFGVAVDSDPFFPDADHVAEEAEGDEGVASGLVFEEEVDADGGFGLGSEWGGEEEVGVRVAEVVVEEGTGDELELVPLDEGGDFCREMLPEEGGGVGRV